MLELPAFQKVDIQVTPTGLPLTARFKWHQEKRWEKKRYLGIELLYELKENLAPKKEGKQAKGELVSIGRK